MMNNAGEDTGNELKCHTTFSKSSEATQGLRVLVSAICGGDLTVLLASRTLQIRSELKQNNVFFALKPPSVK